MAGHSHFSPANVEEHFEFSSEGKKRIIIAFIAGLVALALGIYLLSKGESGGHEVAAAGHEAANAGHEAANAGQVQGSIYPEERLHIKQVLKSIMIGRTVFGLMFG
jgi:hypothetical protein